MSSPISRTFCPISSEGTSTSPASIFTAMPTSPLRVLVARLPPQLPPGEQGLIRAPVRVGPGRFQNLAIPVLVDAGELQRHPGGGSAARGVEGVGRQAAGHQPALSTV